MTHTNLYFLENPFESTNSPQSHTHILFWNNTPQNDQNTPHITFWILKTDFKQRQPRMHHGFEPGTTKDHTKDQNTLGRVTETTAKHTHVRKREFYTRQHTNTRAQDILRSLRIFYMQREWGRVSHRWGRVRRVWPHARTCGRHTPHAHQGIDTRTAWFWEDIDIFECVLWFLKLENWFSWDLVQRLEISK